MRTACLVSVLWLTVACGGYAGDRAKTPDEIVAEEEREAEEDQRQREAMGPAHVGDEELEVDKKAKFDVRQSKIELKRAARSAVTCPGSIGTKEKLPSEKATVTLTFGNDGNVTKSSIEDAFKESKVGGCVLNAMKAVIVPPFSGQEVQVDWVIDFSEAEEESAE
jgi:hypothetical protein